MHSLIARESGELTDSEVQHFDQLRDNAPAEPMSFK
jgi:hypothetical protein